LSNSIKTGINDFFRLRRLGGITNTKSGKIMIKCKNSRGWIGEIEAEYLKVVIRSPKESVRIEIESDNLEYFLFICDKSKSELRESGDYGALNYIEWGETQKTKNNIKWYDVPSVKSRKYWWNISDEEEFEFIIPQFYDKKFLITQLQNKAIATNNFFVIKMIKDRKYENTIFLNSSIFFLFLEILGRNNMGDGVLTFYGPDISKTPLLKDEFKIKFNKIIKRKIKPIFEEIKQKDRIELDRAVLKAMELDPDEYLCKIYNGLTEIVNERLELPKMRKKHSVLSAGVRMA
jgi:hypothetical protein